MLNDYDAPIFALVLVTYMVRCDGRVRLGDTARCVQVDAVRPRAGFGPDFLVSAEILPFEEGEDVHEHTVMVCDGAGCVEFMEVALEGVVESRDGFAEFVAALASGVFVVGVECGGDGVVE
jgi:hypothetical protein